MKFGDHAQIAKHSRDAQLLRVTRADSGPER